MLYLGVASVQLSHVTTTDKHSTHLSLYGRNYSIYSDTRCCKGVDELWKIIAVNNLGVSILYCTIRLLIDSFQEYIIAIVTFILPF